MSIKTSDVTESLRFFISLSSNFYVDAAGYVCKINDEGRHYKYKGSAASEEKEIVVYQETMPEGTHYYTLNPYAEGYGDRTTGQLFFYDSIRAGVVGKVRMLIMLTLLRAISDKGLKITTQLEVPPASKSFMDFLSGKIGKKSILDEVDEKMFTEAEEYLSSRQMKETLISPVPRPRRAESALSIPMLQTENYADNVNGVRKKTVLVIQAILANMFDLHTAEDFERYTQKPDEGAPSKMGSWLKVIYKIYEKINPALEDVDETLRLSVDLSRFRDLLNLLPVFTNNAKFMIIPVEKQAAPSTSTIPSSHLPGPPSVPYPTATISKTTSTDQIPEGYTMVPGPLMADGRQAPGQLIHKVTGQPFAHHNPHLVPPSYPTQPVAPSYPQTPYYPQPPQPQVPPPSYYPSYPQQPPMMPQPGYGNYGQPQGFGGYGQPQSPMNNGFASAMMGSQINQHNVSSLVGPPAGGYNQGYQTVPGMPRNL